MRTESPGDAIAPSHVDVALRDGGRVRCRLGTSDDLTALTSGFELLSDESRYNRFFTALPTLPSPVMRELSLVDSDHVAVAAFDPDRESLVGTADGFGIGVGRLVRFNERPHAAELAVTVIDEYQGRGVGRVIVHALLAVAARTTIRTIVGVTLASNQAMNRLFTELGAERIVDAETQPSVIHYEFSVSDALERIGTSWPDVKCFEPLLG